MSKGTIGPGLLVLTLLFLAVFSAIQKLQNIRDVRKNWDTVRCYPQNMFFANLYGFDANENVQFCLKKGFDTQATKFMKPVFSFLGMFVEILITFLNSINSLRMTFATLVGSVTTVFQNFRDRLTQVFQQFKLSIVRMRFLMNRIYGTMFSIIYMMLSGMTAVTNFGNTFLFSFLDTFCFDPDTSIEVENKGRIPIHSVEIGDILSMTGSRVTATFQFIADGQEMVQFPDGTIVSTNHYVKDLNGEWIFAVDHPHAISAGPWNGGISRPLICLNTHDHQIPIGSYCFCDYDETEDADDQTMTLLLSQLNGDKSSTHFPRKPYDYNVCIESTAQISMADGTYRSASDVRLGDRLPTGIVCGRIRKLTTTYCSLPSGTRIGPASAIWHEESQQWIRAGDLYPVQSLPHPIPFYSFVVIGSASIELKDRTRIRDYVEVHSPDAKDLYGTSLQTSAPPLSAQVYMH